tara:strand:+ start:450 stop:1457 length:1008 start_codon:yes stop_codon:yes gene_type:complete
MKSKLSKIDNLKIEDLETTLEIELHDNSVLIELCGIRDQNLIFLEDKLGIQITRRGNKLSFSGNFEDRKKAANILKNIYSSLEEGRSFDGNDIIDFILTSLKMTDFSSKEKKHENSFNDFDLKTKKKLISPRNNNQKDFIVNLMKYDLTFGIGPAGTGKTYVAIAVAVSMFLKGQVDKVVLTRPAVEAGEKLGFLPGDIKDKIDPYMQPLYDALNDFLPTKQVSKMLEDKKIEIIPLAFMRGRTLSNSFIILDEGQNTTSNQMKMFLTRLGKNSKAAVTGDLTQIDLPKGFESGLYEATKILKKLTDIGFVYFSSKDVVRHNLVQKIVDAYDNNS